MWRKKREDTYPPSGDTGAVLQGDDAAFYSKLFTLVEKCSTQTPNDTMEPTAHTSFLNEQSSSLSKHISLVREIVRGHRTEWKEGNNLFTLPTLRGDQ